MNHIVALSGGKDSVSMAVELASREPRDYDYICTPTGNELPEMIEHWRGLGKVLRKPIKPITSGRSLGGLVRLQNALPNHRMRWCTRMLKIEPFESYIVQHTPCVVYVGIRADEVDRPGVDYDSLGLPLFGETVSRRYPLVEWGWGLGDVLASLQSRGISIPARTDCANCFFQTLYEWYLLWRDHSDLYAEGEGWEALTGHTLRSDQRDTWPASLAALRQRFESGDIPKQRNVKRSQMCSVCAR